jgi:hypothetical protein
MQLICHSQKRNIILRIAHLKQANYQTETYRKPVFYVVKYQSVKN